MSTFALTTRQSVHMVDTIVWITAINELFKPMSAIKSVYLFQIDFGWLLHILGLKETGYHLPDIYKFTSNKENCMLIQIAL